MPKFSFTQTLVCPNLLNPIILSVIAAGTTYLLRSEKPLNALYKTTADYCLLSLETELSRTGID